QVVNSVGGRIEGATIAGGPGIAPGAAAMASEVKAGPVVGAWWSADRGLQVGRERRACQHDRGGRGEQERLHDGDIPFTQNEQDWDTLPSNGPVSSYRYDTTSWIPRTAVFWWYSCFLLSLEQRYSGANRPGKSAASVAAGKAFCRPCHAAFRLIACDQNT